MRYASKELKKEIGRRLKARRNKLGLTQEYLSERIGLETKSYSNIERGIRLFSVEVLLKLMNELEVGADYILTGKSNHNSPITDMIDRLDGENINRLEVIIRLFIEATNGKQETESPAPLQSNRALNLLDIDNP